LAALVASAWRSMPLSSWVVQLAVVKMIDVIAVADGRVAAAGAVLVVLRVAGHAVTSSPASDLVLRPSDVTQARAASSVQLAGFDPAGVSCGRPTRTRCGACIPTTRVLSRLSPDDDLIVSEPFFGPGTVSSVGQAGTAVTARRRGVLEERPSPASARASGRGPCLANALEA